MQFLKDGQIMSTTRWSIVEKVYSKTKIYFCPLCLAEKVHLMVYHGVTPSHSPPIVLEGTYTRLNIFKGGS